MGSCDLKKTSNISKCTKINISEKDFLEKVNYNDLYDSTWQVKLETTKQSIIVFCDRLFITDKTILIFDRSQSSVFIFNLNGSYLTKINSIGKGPNEYLHPEEAFINSKNELVLCDPSIQKNFYYSLNGAFIRTTKIEDIPFYNMLELNDGGTVFFTGCKGNSNKRVANNHLYMKTPKNKNLFLMPNDGELKIKIVAADSYLIRGTDEVLFYYPFRNTLYNIGNYELEPLYNIDINNRNLPDEAFFSINHDRFMEEFVNNPKYYYILGGIQVSSKFIIIPVYNQIKLYGNVYFSRETKKIICSKKILFNDNSEKKINPRWISNDLIAEISDSYNSYLTDTKFSNSDLSNPTITFYKIKNF